MPPPATVALATCAEHPALDAEGRMLLEALRARGVAAQPAVGRPLYARVDVLRDAAGAPALLEVELIEPSLFLDHMIGAADHLARAIVARLGAAAR